MSAGPAAPARIGGHLVTETLQALGAQVAFGVPGIHSLAIWEALRTSPITAYGNRTELCAGFAADGYARSTARPAPLLLSTGPGALNSLTAMMEAASSHVPVVAISSQIPSELLGRGRGYLHELPDQLASFAPLVKHAERSRARSDPRGARPGVADRPDAALGPRLRRDPRRPADRGGRSRRRGGRAGRARAGTRPPPSEIATAVAELRAARRPVIWAGGGVIRSGAQAELLELAERLDAPVATTYMGKGALPDVHPLAAGAAATRPPSRSCSERRRRTLRRHRARRRDDRPVRAAVRRTRDPRRCRSERIGATYPALGLVGDARATLRALLDELPAGDARGDPATAPSVWPPFAPGSRRAERPGPRAGARSCWRGGAGAPAPTRSLSGT